MSKISSEKDLEQKKKTGLDKLYPDKIKISVGMASCGLAAGAGKVFENLQQYITKNKLDVVLSPSGCLGFCRMEPLLTVHIPGQPKIVYSNISADKAVDLLTSVLNKSESQQALCRIDEEEFILEGTSKKLSINGIAAKSITSYNDVPFFKKQKRIVLRNCGFINSDDIDEYIGRSGYSALLKVLKTMKHQEVIEQVKRSGLRGRGGAGFPTGIKWELCRKAEGDIKYIVCNADEGDPGAYMDRSVLEGDPHSVLEGMLIGAYAIGASEGFFYVRAEYPLAVEKLHTTIEQARQYGFLGEDIFGTGFDFDVHIVEGLGAFVCGEETSLIASIEGRPAEPLPRPPYPAQSGLWGKPTNINNVETWANIPVIIMRGGDWYAGIGTEKSKGTKVFSLVGAVKNSGLVEVPMGTTLNEIVNDIGQGIQNGKKLKAIQTGGPSGGCIPANLADSPVDYEKLAEIGSIMGSGGLVVLDEDNCMVDIARFFTAFTRSESCGKCTSCRDGLDAAHQVLTRIVDGQANDEDIELLKELSETIRDASQCALGKSAPNPILTTMKYFEQEYDQHVNGKKCSAGVCKPLVKYYIEADKCKACGKCKTACPIDAIEGQAKVPHAIIAAKCTKCGACYDICPFDAVVRN
jgi:NADH:ubiquinone oxidoreductase subunit F (NADH-binding)/(2Fe-2S) ferredoxin/NAD-dependent dihydropyrimidine dehydrogenase PreA subunit